MSNYYQMENFFRRKSEFQVRNKKKALGDSIHRALPCRELEKNFPRKEIIVAMKSGWVAKETISPNGRTMMHVYLWLDECLPQRTGYKKWIMGFRDWMTDKWFDLTEWMKEVFS